MCNDERRTLESAVDDSGAGEGGRGLLDAGLGGVGGERHGDLRIGACVARVGGPMSGNGRLG